MTPRAMIQTPFEASVGFVLAAEGVLSDDPGDPGGLTKYGHDQASWPATLARLPADVRSTMPTHVALLTRAQAIVAYDWAYWRWAHCDLLPPPVALLVFDATVNGGSPVVWLQHAVGAETDGVLGPDTLRALTAKVATGGGAAVLAEFQAWHLAYLASLPTWRRFGADNGRPLGWVRRAFSMCFATMQMPAAQPISLAPAATARP